MIPLIKDLGIIIVAGGSSSRFGNKNKLLAQLDDFPVFSHSIRNFHQLCPSENLILVVSTTASANFTNALRKYLPAIKVKIVSGGETRMHSVLNGLNALSENAEFAAIHDAARPLTSADTLLKCLSYARKNDGAIVAKKITDTVKIASTEGIVEKTLDRDLLWTIETPQIFPVTELKKAYRKAFSDNKFFTDDAGVMEYSGKNIFLMENKNSNHKITYPDDINIIESIMGKHVK